ncbi:MAG: hypothetical protein IPK39_07500 [Sulfuritalea sp.]|nr:hypothetical protein [Sulfuritalea sp.]
MNADDLARRIVVRHREAGYLRLELPAAICHPAVAEVIDAALRRVAGVYRVTLYIAQHRLVVSFDAHVCAATDVAKALKASLRELPKASTAAAPPHTPMPHTPGALAARVSPALHQAARQARRAFRRLRARIEGLRQPNAASGSLQAKLQPMLANALTEKAMINFLNDLVAFYLVKVHWELITQRWLKNPAKHADAWLAAFYLVFLLVRYRKSIAAEIANPVAKSATVTPS